MEEWKSHTPAANHLKKEPHPLNTRLGQPQTLSGYFGEKQNLALLGIKP